MVLSLNSLVDCFYFSYWYIIEFLTKNPIMPLPTTTFIYFTKANLCFVKKNQRFTRELTIKGPTTYHSAINGTWFQVNHLTNHWIAFYNKNHTWEAFYKWVSQGEIKYYRKVFKTDNTLLVFNFTKSDEWIKVNGKWKTKNGN